MCVLRLVSIILSEISAHHFQLKRMGCHFFSVPSLHREYYRTDNFITLQSKHLAVKRGVRFYIYIRMLCTNSQRSGVYHHNNRNSHCYLTQIYYIIDQLQYLIIIRMLTVE